MAHIGIYDVNFFVGLETESDSELMTRVPEQTMTLVVINDECQSALVPNPLMTAYKYNINAPTTELVIELDAESNNCAFTVSSVAVAPPSGQQFVTVSNDGIFFNNE